MVIGTGFHRWVLGASMAGHFQALLDWNALLLQVAAGLGCERQRALTAGRLELLAKRQAVQVLAQSKADYPAHSRRMRLPLGKRIGYKWTPTLALAL